MKVIKRIIGQKLPENTAVVLLKIANGNPELMPNGEIWTDDTIIGLTEKGREQAYTITRS